MSNHNCLKILVAGACLLFLTIGHSSHAQVAKGKWLAGGAITYQTGSEFEFAGQKISALGSDVSAFGFAPRVSYALSDRLVVGGRLGLAFASEEQTVAGQTVKFRANGFAIAPFARYYLSLGNRAYFFGEAAFNVGSINLNSDGQNLFSFSLFQVGINPGFAFFITDTISIELMVNGISFSSLKEKEASEPQDAFNLGPNFDQRGPTLGIQFFF
ncbi:hypothetical protein BKI52_02050 [marine bacterium AO1-C]|nr:hypothetical protein BKI52_02050 [marine bacterium AO1-C]